MEKKVVVSSSLALFIILKICPNEFILWQALF